MHFISWNPAGGSVPDLYMPLYVRSLEQCTMFFVHMAGSQASGDLRSDPTTKIVVPPGTEFCTRVRERLRGKKMQKITNLHETFASLDNLSKSGIMR